MKEDTFTFVIQGHNHINKISKSRVNEYNEAYQYLFTTELLISCLFNGRNFLVLLSQLSFSFIRILAFGNFILQLIMTCNIICIFIELIRIKVHKNSMFINITIVLPSHRASSKRLFTSHLMNILAKQLQYDRLGLIRKCLDSRGQFVRLVASVSRKTAIKW